jgi:23S rRNA (adenine2503-C2)-methyltransferase
MRENFKAYSLGQAKDIMTRFGLDEYRGEQVFKWIWQKNADDFSKMTNLSKELRTFLEDKYVIRGLAIVMVKKENGDVRKYGLRLEDGEHIESVFIQEDRRRTICVSCQVECPLDCKFCATGLMGFKRNLAAYEIADQVRVIQTDVGDRCTNVVFMGMGEPLLNYKEVTKALEIVYSPLALSIGRRHTTVSTVGLLNGIEQLLRSPVRVKLAISLNFADEEKRKELMPVTKSNPLRDLLRLAKVYSIEKEMVTFEYVMIDKINDSLKDAKKLLRMLKGIPSKINLIPYNEHPRLPFKRPIDAQIEKFYECLLDSYHTVVIRKSRGQNILAGCGQLAGDL